MKTEAEAEKLWCPYVRYGGGGDESLGNDYLMTNNIGAKCLASRCMMWRKGGERPLDQYRERVELVGFCGLGGKP